MATLNFSRLEFILCTCSMHVLLYNLILISTTSSGFGSEFESKFLCAQSLHCGCDGENDGLPSRNIPNLAIFLYQQRPDRSKYRSSACPHGRCDTERAAWQSVGQIADQPDCPTI